MRKQDIKIGCDPEFFVYDTEAKANISCHTFMKGDKKNPYPLKNGAVQVDGTAIEFNIEATSDPTDFAANVQKTLDEIRGMVPNKYQFQFKPHVIYDEKYFSTLPSQCIELGCDPDFDALTGKMNPPPKPTGKYKTMRTGAGHLHIGWTSGKDINDPSHAFDAMHVADNLHRLLVDTELSTLWDNDKLRKNLYGANAAYRPKSYGCELRSPSNAWLNYPKLWPWLAETAQAATMYMYETGNKLFTQCISTTCDNNYYYCTPEAKRMRYCPYFNVEKENNTSDFTLQTKINAYNYLYTYGRNGFYLPPLSIDMLTTT